MATVSTDRTAIGSTSVAVSGRTSAGSGAAGAGFQNASAQIRVDDEERQQAGHERDGHDRVLPGAEPGLHQREFGEEPGQRRHPGQGQGRDQEQGGQARVRLVQATLVGLSSNVPHRRRTTLVIRNRLVSTISGGRCRRSRRPAPGRR